MMDPLIKNEPDITMIIYHSGSLRSIVTMRNYSDLFYFISRYRNVTIWPLVQVISGEKWVLSVPFVIPLPTAHSTGV